VGRTLTRHGRGFREMLGLGREVAQRQKIRVRSPLMAIRSPASRLATNSWLRAGGGPHASRVSRNKVSGSGVELAILSRAGKLLPEDREAFLKDRENHLSPQHRSSALDGPFDPSKAEEVSAIGAIQNLMPPANRSKPQGTRNTMPTIWRKATSSGAFERRRPAIRSPVRTTNCNKVNPSFRMAILKLISGCRRFTLCLSHDPSGCWRTAALASFR
jgi:hypothetical protein